MMLLLLLAADAGIDQLLPQHDKLINLYNEARAAARSAIRAAQTGGGKGGAPGLTMLKVYSIYSWTRCSIQSREHGAL